jgi:hypothetical protein
LLKGLHIDLEEDIEVDVEEIRRWMWRIIWMLITRRRFVSKFGLEGLHVDIEEDMREDIEEDRHHGARCRGQHTGRLLGGGSWSSVVGSGGSSVRVVDSVYCAVGGMKSNQSVRY